MVSVRLLSPEHLWDILSFCPRAADQEPAWEPWDAERYRQGQHRRAGFLARKMDQGARLQVAYRDGVAVGFIEYYPIEIANLEILGQDILAISCMLVRDKRQGVGSALLQACLDDAQALGRKGVAISCPDPDWMPRALSERFGFVDVGPAEPSGALLYSSLGGPAGTKPPRWVGRRPEIAPYHGQIVVDVYHTDRCPIHWRNTVLVQEVAQEFGDAVFWRQHWTDEREDALYYGTAYSIYINGELVVAGPPVTRDGVKQALREALPA